MTLLAPCIVYKYLNMHGFQISHLLIFADETHFTSCKREYPIIMQKNVLNIAYVHCVSACACMHARVPQSRELGDPLLSLR